MVDSSSTGGLSNKFICLEIIKFLKNSDIMKIELINKACNSIVNNFYFNQTALFHPKEKTGETNQEINNKETIKEDIGLFKKLYYKSYMDSMLIFNISDKKFEGVDPNSEENTKIKENEIKESKPRKLSLSNESPSIKLNEELMFKNQASYTNIKEIIVEGNNIFILYFSGELKFFIKSPNSNNYEYYFKIHIQNLKIKKILYSSDSKCFVLLDYDDKLFYMISPNLNEDESKISVVELKNINMKIKSIYNLKNFIIILDQNDQISYFSIEKLLNEKQELKNKIIEETKAEKEVIPTEKEPSTFTQLFSITGPFSSLLRISKNDTKIIFLDSNSKLFFISENDLKKSFTNSQNLVIKPTHEFKSKNIVYISIADNHWIALEREDIKPIEDWDSAEVLEWFKKLDLHDFLNIVKYEKITGKDILNGDERFFDQIMGMPNDIMQKLRYEINQVKNLSAKTVKLWGWGSHKFGQLGLPQNNNNKENFYKIPVEIKLPTLSNECDYISKVFCGKTYSVIMSQLGEIFITGNYENKYIEKESENKHNPGGKGDKPKKSKKENEMKNDKKKEKVVQLHRWVNITNTICFSKDLFFKTKILKCLGTSILFFGYKSPNTPFTLTQAKPKSKHLGAGSKKFINSDKVLERIVNSDQDKNNYMIIYEDPLLKKLETTIDEFFESEVPYHKIIQIKYYGEIIWDRKKRYYKYE